MAAYTPANTKGEHQLLQTLHTQNLAYTDTVF